MASTHIPAINDAIVHAAARRSAERGWGWRTEFAEAIGVSRNAVSTWFKGTTTPHAGHWPAIERELGIEPGALARMAAEHLQGQAPPQAAGRGTRHDLTQRIEALETQMATVRGLLDEALALLHRGGGLP